MTSQKSTSYQSSCFSSNAKTRNSRSQHVLKH